VLAVTSEGTSDTEKWVASKGAKYAYAYDKGGKLSSYFGIRGIPAAVLIDASGTVVWSGHPGGIDESAIEKAVAGALPKPLWEWSGAAKGVKNALLKRNYKKALEEAAKLGEDDGGPMIKSQIEGIVKSRVEGMKKAYDEGDYLEAETASKALVKELAGLPEADEAAKVAADLEANDQAQPILKAQRQVAKLAAAELSKRKEIDAAIEDLKDIAKKHPGTVAARQADALVETLRKAKSK
jgi:hypothetical protein